MTFQEAPNFRLGAGALPESCTNQVDRRMTIAILLLRVPFFISETLSVLGFTRRSLEASILPLYDARSED